GGPAQGSPARLGPLPPRRGRRCAPLRGHRSGSVHLPRHRGAARRTDLGGKHRGWREYVPRDAARDRRWEAELTVAFERAGLSPELPGSPRGGVRAGARPDAREAAGTPILVVDDDPEILAMLRDFLEGEGFSIRTATNGAEALQ